MGIFQLLARLPGARMITNEVSHVGQGVPMAQKAKPENSKVQGEAESLASVAADPSRPEVNRPCPLVDHAATAAKSGGPYEELRAYNMQRAQGK